MANVINVFALHARPGKSRCQRIQISHKVKQKSNLCDFNSREENQKLWARTCNIECGTFIPKYSRFIATNNFFSRQKSYTSNLMGLYDTFHTRFRIRCLNVQLRQTDTETHIMHCLLLAVSFFLDGSLHTCTDSSK